MLRKKALLASAGIGTLLLAGCSGAAEPRQDLQDAAKAFDKANAVSMTMSITGDKAGLDSMFTGDPDVPEMTQKLLTESNIVVRYDKKGTETPDDDVVALDVNVKGSALGNIVSAGEVMYLKVNFDELGKISPDVTSSLDEVRSAADTMPELASWKPLFNGDWVKIDAAESGPLAGALGSKGSDPANDPQAQETVKELRQAMLKIANDAEVSRDKSDKTHLKVTANAKKVYQELYPVFNKGAALTDSVAGGAALPDPSEVPDQDLVADVWVKSGKFQKVEFNLAQMSDELKGRVALKVDLKEIDKVDVPADAAPIDFGSMLGGM